MRKTETGGRTGGGKDGGGGQMVPEYGAAFAFSLLLLFGSDIFLVPRKEANPMISGATKVLTGGT